MNAKGTAKCLKSLQNSMGMAHMKFGIMWACVCKLDS